MWFVDRIPYILGSDQNAYFFYQIWVVSCVGSLFCGGFLLSILVEQSSSLVMEDRVGCTSILCVLSVFVSFPR